MSAGGHSGVFRSQATQYYVAGRAAARVGLATVYGNLLHHAVEMFLKAGLVASHKVKNLSHNLIKIWEESRKQNADLDRFLSPIAQLDKFEDIRYPENLVASDSSLHIAFDHAESLASTGANLSPGIVGTEIYEVVIADVDALVICVLDHDAVEPWRLSGMLMESARDAIGYRNAFAERWRFPP